MKKPNKKSIIATVIVVLAVIAGALAIKKAKDKDAATKVAKQYDVVVRTQKVKQENIELTLPTLAIVQNDKDVMIASKIPARVIFVKPSGSKVKKGDVIARLDNTGVRSNINSVKAQLESVQVAIKNMEATHQRTLELLKVEGASVEQSQKEESMLSEMYAKRMALTQKMNEANNTLSYTNLRSPVTGIVSKTMVNAGDMAMPGHPIANLKSDNGFFLLVRVPSSVDVKGLKLNSGNFDAIPLNSTFNGLSEYKTYVNMPGMTSGDRIKVDVAVFKGAGILLPFDAIINRSGKSFVLVKEGDKAVAHEVQLIESGEQGVVIGNEELIGKEIVIAKQDILLKLLGGVSLKVKNE